MRAREIIRGGRAAAGPLQSSKSSPVSSGASKMRPRIKLKRRQRAREESDSTRQKSHDATTKITGDHQRARGAKDTSLMRTSRLLALLALALIAQECLVTPSQQQQQAPAASQYSPNTNYQQRSLASNQLQSGTGKLLSIFRFCARDRCQWLSLFWRRRAQVNNHTNRCDV